jgi:hypothetical protein
METVALTIAVMSLVLAGVAYWRTGGKQDLELLREDHRELAEATTAVRAKAQDLQQRIEHALAETDKLLGSLESDETKAS